MWAGKNKSIELKSTFEPCWFDVGIVIEIRNLFYLNIFNKFFYHDVQFYFRNAILFSDKSCWNIYKFCDFYYWAWIVIDVIISIRTIKFITMAQRVTSNLIYLHSSEFEDGTNNNYEPIKSLNNSHINWLSQKLNCCSTLSSLA